MRIFIFGWTNFFISFLLPELKLQAFYPATNTIDVKNGDILAARCMFTGEGRTTNTEIG